MTPIEQYEAQQRALETERFARLARDLEEDAKNPAPFCAPYGEKDAEPGALVWLRRVLFVVVLAAAFYTAARWVMP